MRAARFLIVLLALSASRAAAVDRVTLVKPVRVLAQETDKTRIVGKITSYDSTGFEISDAKGATQTIRWDAFDARTVFQIRASLLGEKDAAGWIDLGHDLVAFSDGKDWSDRAFARALRIDPKLKDKVAEAKAAPAAASAAPSPEASGPPGSSETAKAGNGPKTVGATQDKFWGQQSDADQAEQVKQLEAFADDTAFKLQRPLKLNETKYFLFYSDLAPVEAANWSGLLDRMYDRLAELFAVTKGANVWRGKALVFVFTQPQDYRRFEKEIHNTDPGESAGMCHCFGDGLVHIAFYRQPNELVFAHVLVHESVHGFVHRYRSPVFIPSWANEGLAEVIASELVPDPPRTQQRRENCRYGIESHGNSMGDIFAADHIVGWQYPVAESLCEFMIRQSKSGYVQFINGIKDGLRWDESLDQKYKAPKDRLVQAFGASINIKSLKP